MAGGSDVGKRQGDPSLWDDLRQAIDAGGAGEQAVAQFLHEVHESPYNQEGIDKAWQNVQEVLNP